MEGIVQICFDTKQWDLLNENIIALTKRRSQLEAAVTKMVQRCCTYVDRMPNEELKLKLIDTLRTVTAGKVTVSFICLIKQLVLIFYKLLLDLCGS